MFGKPLRGGSHQAPARAHEGADAHAGSLEDPDRLGGHDHVPSFVLADLHQRGAEGGFIDRGDQGIDEVRRVELDRQGDGLDAD